MKKLVVRKKLRRIGSRVAPHFALNCGATQVELRRIMGRKLPSSDASDTVIWGIYNRHFGQKTVDSNPLYVIYLAHCLSGLSAVLVRFPWFVIQNSIG